MVVVVTDFKFLDSCPDEMYDGGEGHEFFRQVP